MSIIPTISSGTAGPLGVQHLPRLWQKASLDAAGKLHPDYPAAGAGFDQMTLDALGIDRQALGIGIRGVSLWDWPCQIPLAFGPCN